MIEIWLQFIVCATIIILAGNRLTKSAAIIAKNTGIGTAWAGALMLPLATSLPELVSTLRAVAINAPDLAVGNILGSCLYNLALLALIDILEGRGALTSRLYPGHVVAASLSIISISMVSVALLGIINLSLGWVGVESLIIAVVYITGNRMLYRYEKEYLRTNLVEGGFKSAGQQAATGSALLQFLIAAIFIVAAGVIITDLSDRIALMTGLGHTFVGTVFLAISTSLPETVTTITAVRLGLIDMAVANVFGANFMNLFIVSIADIFYTGGPILYGATDYQLISTTMIILMSTVIIVGMAYRSKRRIVGLGYDALLVFAGYIITIFLLYRNSVN